jgi:hypothetical protein
MVNLNRGNSLPRGSILRSFGQKGQKCHVRLGVWRRLELLAVARCPKTAPQYSSSQTSCVDNGLRSGNPHGLERNPDAVCRVKVDANGRASQTYCKISASALHANLPKIRKALCIAGELRRSSLLLFGASSANTRSESQMVGPRSIVFNPTNPCPLI